LRCCCTGEHNLWCKKTNFELAVKVPLLVYVPWLPQAMGQRTNTIVELVDLYPTLSDLAHLPSPLGGEIKPNEGGSSFLSSFLPSATVSSAFTGADGSQNPHAVGNGASVLPSKQYAFTQYPRCGGGPKNLQANGDCLQVQAVNFTTMGYSVRDTGFRYTEWKEWIGASLTPNWAVTVAAELYDHRGDDGLDFDAYENENVLNSTALQQDVARLSSALRAHFLADGRHVNST
jgi:iduronate 2-sulfatase